MNISNRGLFTLNIKPYISLGHVQEHSIKIAMGQYQILITGGMLFG
jgi:hypothetical protein